MVIKWKKSNISILVFYVFGISFFLIGMLGILREARFEENFDAYREMLLYEDYQDTAEFRDFISGRLKNFLRMACGDYISDMSGSLGELSEGDAFYGEAAYVGMEAAEDDLTREEKWESVNNYHKCIRTDKNLLYRIVKDGNVMFANTEDAGWDYSARNLPDGYNFLLRFDGEKVEIQKDKKTLDIYGDGVYREGEDWRVPGFKNLSASAKWKGISISILAAKEPMIYEGADAEGYYEEYGFWPENDLYYMYKDHTERREDLQRFMGFLMAGLFFMAWYRLRRKEKRYAGKQIAKLTGKMWFEWKALCFFVLPVLLCFFLLNQGDMAIACADEMMMESLPASVIVSEVSEYLLYDLGNHITGTLIVFWLFYLFVCDLRNNRGSCKKGFFGKFAAALNKKNLKLPLARRMVKRFYGIFFLTAAQLAVIFALFVSAAVFEAPGSFFIFILAALAVTAALLGAEYAYQKKNRILAADLERLSEQISGIRDGNYSEPEGFLTEDEDVRRMAEGLEEIRQGFEDAVEERIRSERMKVELVANVSHDIKTPLTSIISYIQLLKQEENLPDYAMDYIRILDEKSERLRTMVQDVFAVSKAASGQLEVKMELLDLGKLLWQTLADMEEVIKRSPVVLKTEIPKEPVFVRADGQRMYRVFQNLIGNAAKYSLEGSRVYVTLKEEGGIAEAGVKNTSSRELTGEINFAERFVRGDESRTDGGSGLGLSIAQSFTEACGGTFSMETIADLFIVTVTFDAERGDVL